jgi:phosphohistidine swiveling domain-containing protein
LAEMMECIALSAIGEERGLRLRVGGKGWGLGVVLRGGRRVPPGVVVPVEGFFAHLESGGLWGEIERELAGGEGDWFERSRRLRERVRGVAMPEAVWGAIEAGVEGLPGEWLAVRSSGVREDERGASYAGVYESYLGVRRGEELREAVVGCWASAFNASALYYGSRMGAGGPEGMAVVIQAMVAAEASGVALTSYPDADHVTVEAVRGLGSVLVSGEVEPDRYVVGKAGLGIEERALGEKRWAARLGSEGVVVERSEGGGLALTDAWVEAVAEEAAGIEEWVGRPQDVEWCVAGEALWILQARDLVRGHPVGFSEYFAALDRPVIAGRVFAPGEREARAPEGRYLLVIGTADPRYLAYLERAEAVVSEEGGLLNHLAIVCRELGIPFIRLPGATETLREGEWAELSVRSGAPQAESPTDWVNLFTYLPDLPLEAVQAAHLRVARALPGLIGLDYELTARIAKQALWIEKASLDRFLGDLCDHVAALNDRLDAFERLAPEERFALAALAMVAVDRALFPRLLHLTGDHNAALQLLKSGSAAYLELDGRPSGSLMRFGIPEGRMETPAELRARLETQRARGGSAEARSLPDGVDAGHVEQLARAISGLIRAYESKNAPPEGGAPV